MQHTHDTISGYFRLLLSDHTQGICRKFTFKDPDIYSIHKTTVLFSIIYEMSPEL